jgi:hypothetical protein
MSAVEFLKQQLATQVLSLQDISIWIDASTLGWVVMDLKG